MAMEVVCGNCQGRLLVEHTGVVVACPHCGAHLQIGEPTPPAAELPPQSVPAPAPQNVPLHVEPPAPFVAPVPDPLFAPQQSIPAAAGPVEVSPFPSFFGAPPPDTKPLETGSSEKKPPEIAPAPLFPEFNFAAPSAPSAVPVGGPVEPLIATNASSFAAPSPAEGVALPSWEPSAQPAPLPFENPESADSWTPQINLTMPPATIEAAPPPPVVPAVVIPSPPLAEPETATQLNPVVPVVDVSPSAVNLTDIAPSGVPANQTDIWSPTRLEQSHVEEPMISFPGNEPGFTNFGNFNASPAVTPAFNAMDTQPVAVLPPPATSNTPTLNATAEPAANSSSPDNVKPSVPRGAVVSRFYFIVMASYASAVTLAFLYLWWRSSPTLDLPDVVPAIGKNGQYGLTLIKESPLPPAYRLKLGESKRYGNLLVTPLKVTRGPLEFVHFGDAKQTRPASESPVLKLWVKFENVSADQTFPALDEKLLFQRIRDRKKNGQDRSNNYVCLQSECKPTGKRVGAYAFPINGEWLLKDQNLNTPLAPHKQWETYIPTSEEGLNELSGPLCWRFHFRKGYNPQSGRGVTTLVEVEFDSADIQTDSEKAV